MVLLRRSSSWTLAAVASRLALMAAQSAPLEAARSASSSSLMPCSASTAVAYLNTISLSLQDTTVLQLSITRLGALLHHKRASDWRCACLADHRLCC